MQLGSKNSLRLIQRSGCAFLMLVAVYLVPVRAATAVSDNQGLNESVLGLIPQNSPPVEDSNMLGHNAGCLACQLDSMWLVSSRHLSRCGTHDGSRLEICHREACGRSWKKTDLDDFLVGPDSALPTYVYVHGNRVDRELACERGVMVYRQLRRYCPHRFRFVVWSWPSDIVQGVVRDARVKACRSDADAYYLGWMLANTSSESPVSLIGFSLGARVVTGAVHLLAGGTLAGRTLPKLAESSVRPRVVLVAPALHNDWLLPSRYHGRALTAVDRMLVLYNSKDPLLRLYRFISGNDNPQALGYTGLALADCSYRGCVCQRDVSGWIGRTHSFKRSFSSPSLMAMVRRHAIW